MRHSIPNWIDALLTADGDETQRSGVKNFRVTKAPDFLLSFILRFCMHASPTEARVYHHTPRKDAC